MKYFCFALCFAIFTYSNQAFGSEAGMPQLNPEFWIAQIFWLLLIFISLYLIILKIFLPKITYSIESRRSKLVNDLNETQKLKENAEKKLTEYNKIITNAKVEANKLIEDNKKKLDSNLNKKKQKIYEEIELEITTAENEIKDLKKTSLLNISKIASETSAEIIKQIINTEVNKSNVTAIVDDIVKKRMENQI